MEDAQGGDRQRGLFRKVVHRGKKGIFLGSDVYPPPGVRVTRFGFRRVDRPNGQVAWRRMLRIGEVAAEFFEIRMPAEILPPVNEFPAHFE